MLPHSTVGSKEATNDHLPLHPVHRQKLQGSTWTDETIRLCKVYTEDDTEEMIPYLGHLPAYLPIGRPALVFPHFDRHGKPLVYRVFRFMPPLLNWAGEEVKYLTPIGVGSRAYFAPMEILHVALRTPGAFLMITEGILKAVAACQAGVPCIGLMGMQNWSVKRGNKRDPRELIQDLAEINWAVRSATARSS